MRRLLFLAVLGLWACNAPGHGRAVAPVKVAPVALPQPRVMLRGSFSDGTPLTLEALKGRPWVVNLWLPG